MPISSSSAMSRQQMENNTHARLSASSAARWLACPGSVQLSEGMPNVTSFPAAEGTFAHEIAAKCLSAPPGTLAAKADYYVNRRATIDGHEITCDEEMAEAVQEYVDEVRRYIDEDTNCSHWVEHAFTPALKKLHPDFGGTADACVYRHDDKVLRVYDYKHGSGVWVNVVENKQLKYYALGALLELQRPAETVEVAIVQPRHHGAGETIRVWTFDAVELVDYAADLIDAAHLTNSFDAPLNAGQEQCKWCPAAPKCPELEKYSMALVAKDFDVQSPVAIEPEKLSAALDMIPLLEARISQIREYAYHEAAAGRPPPGYKLVDKRAMRRWTNDEQVEAWLESICTPAGLEEAHTPPKLRSVAQIEKLMKKEEYGKTTIPEELVSKTSSGYNLVPESDKRPPAQLAGPGDFEDETEKVTSK